MERERESSRAFVPVFSRQHPVQVDDHGPWAPGEAGGHSLHPGRTVSQPASQRWHYQRAARDPAQCSGWVTVLAPIASRRGGSPQEYYQEVNLSMLALPSLFLCACGGFAGFVLLVWEWASYVGTPCSGFFPGCLANPRANAYTVCTCWINSVLRTLLEQCQTQLAFIILISFRRKGEKAAKPMKQCSKSRLSWDSGLSDYPDQLLLIINSCVSVRAESPQGSDSLTLQGWSSWSLMTLHFPDENTEPQTGFFALPSSNTHSCGKWAGQKLTKPRRPTFKEKILKYQVFSSTLEFPWGKAVYLRSLSSALASK